MDNELVIIKIIKMESIPPQAVIRGYEVCDVTRIECYLALQRWSEETGVFVYE